ncbi:Ig-like domain repeat protein, partial [Candidatus Dependentiae bacterium]|nr:Ig-like domain repeat protein [Candidatus Dependentiae bacterium]
THPNIMQIYYADTGTYITLTDTYIDAIGTKVNRDIYIGHNTAELSLLNPQSNGYAGKSAEILLTANKYCEYIDSYTAIIYQADDTSKTDFKKSGTNGFYIINTNIEFENCSETVILEIDQTTYHGDTGTDTFVFYVDKYAPVSITKYDTAGSGIDGITLVEEPGRMRVKIDWSADPAIDTGSGLKGYNIYRSETEITDLTQAVKIGETSFYITGYTDKAPAPFKTYYYAVTSVDNVGNEQQMFDDYPIEISYDSEPPVSLTNDISEGIDAIKLVADTIARTVTLDWSADMPEDNYKILYYNIYRDTEVITEEQRTACELIIYDSIPAPANIYIDVKPEKTPEYYYYAITAVDNFGNEQIISPYAFYIQKPASYKEECTIWYADASNGSDYNNGGSETEAFLTINQTMQAIEYSRQNTETQTRTDKIILMPGIYDEEIKISANNICIEGLKEKSEEIILKCSGDNIGIISGENENPSNLKIKNLTVEMGDNTLIYAIGGDIEISNIIFRDEPGKEVAYGGVIVAEINMDSLKVMNCIFDFKTDDYSNFIDVCAGELKLNFLNNTFYGAKSSDAFIFWEGGVFDLVLYGNKIFIEENNSVKYSVFNEEAANSKKSDYNILITGNREDKIIWNSNGTQYSALEIREWKNNFEGETNSVIYSGIAGTDNGGSITPDSYILNFDADLDGDGTNDNGKTVYYIGSFGLANPFEPRENAKPEISGIKINDEEIPVQILDEINNICWNYTDPENDKQTDVWVQISQDSNFNIADIIDSQLICYDTNFIYFNRIILDNADTLFIRMRLNDGYVSSNNLSYWSEWSNVYQINNSDGADTELEKDTIPPVISLKYTQLPAITNQNIILSDYFEVSDNVSSSDKITITGNTGLYDAENNYSVIVIAIDEAGNTTSREFNFIIDKSAPYINAKCFTVENGMDSEISLSVDKWYNKTVKIIFSARDNLSGVSDTEEIIIIQSEGQNQSAEWSVSDYAGNMSYLKIENINIDKTEPRIELVKRINEFVNSDVILEYNANDSNVVIIYGDNSPYTSEGLHNVVLTATDAAGNTSSLILSFMIDKTAPAISAECSVLNAENGEWQTVQPAENVWFNKVVKITFTATDNLSGLIEDSKTIILSEESYNQSALWIAQDLAGNTSVFSVDKINIDKTAPVLTINPVVTPTNQDVILSYSVNEECVVSGDTIFTNEGNYTAILTATDLAGNTTSASVSFTIDKTEPAISAECTILNADNGEW